MKKINLKDFTPVGDLKDIGKNYNIIAKVIFADDYSKENITQKGFVSDRSGGVDYIILKKSIEKQLETGKVYVLKNVKLNTDQVNKNRLQIHITASSDISLYKKEKVVSGNLPDAKKNVSALPPKKIIKAEEKPAQEKLASPQNQEMPKTFCSEKTLHKILQMNKEDLEKIEKKKKELSALHKSLFKSRALKGSALLACLMIIVYAAHFIYDYSVRTSLKTGDIINFESAAGAHSFKVSDYDKESDMVTAVSQDEYKEEIHIARHARVEKISVSPSKQAAGSFEASSYVYGYNVDRQNDHVAPDIFTTKIFVNSEEDDEILKKLPGIGVKRLKDLKAARPFKNIQDVMNAKVGVGLYWAKQWEKGVKSGTLIFD